MFKKKCVASRPQDPWLVQLPENGRARLVGCTALGEHGGSSCDGQLLFAVEARQCYVCTWISSLRLTDTMHSYVHTIQVGAASLVGDAWPLQGRGGAPKLGGRHLLL